MPINQFPTLTGQGLLRPSFNIDLLGGESFLLPVGQSTAGMFASIAGQTGFSLSGQYNIDLGGYCDYQYLDPVLEIWRNYGPYSRQVTSVYSDATNFRISNSTGCPVAAIITNAGTGLTNGFNTVTVTPSAGASTWNTIVGGTINATVTITKGGSGFTYAPILVFNPPAAQGNTPYILPTATAAISSGVISAVTVVDQGAGLVAAPTIQVINNPLDTTGGGAVLTVNATLTNSGKLVWMAPATYGTPQTAAVTFTFNPSSTIAATAIMNFVVTGFTVGTAGVALGTSLPFLVTSDGGNLGATAAAAVPGNPGYDVGFIKPRLAIIQGTSTSGGAATATGIVIVDKGYGLQSVPGLYVQPTNLPTTWPVLTATVGSTTAHAEFTSI